MAGTPVTLLLTNSIDYVADLIVSAIGTDYIFRYNSDLWRDYRVAVDGSTIELQNPVGRRVVDSDIAKVYRRSNVRASTLFPEHSLSKEEAFAEEEVWTVWNDLFNIFWRQGKAVLVQPHVNMRLGKLQQLRLAERYLRVAPYRFLINAPDKLREDSESVAKSFTFKYETGVGFYSQRVRESDLDPSYPWFLTDYVPTTHDVTVVVIRDALFAFALDRSPFLNQTIDWRLAASEYAHRHWHEVVIPRGIRAGITRFIADAMVHFARIDFLDQGDDQ